MAIRQQLEKLSWQYSCCVIGLFHCVGCVSVCHLCVDAGVETISHQLLVVLMLVDSNSHIAVLQCDSGCVSTISCWLLEIVHVVTVILDDCRPSKAASAAAYHSFFQMGNALKNLKYCISTYVGYIFKKAI